MNDDDLDLELDDELVQPEKPAAPRAEAKPAPDKGASQAAKAGSGATVAGQRKGFLSGLSNSLAAVKGLAWSTRTFVVGLIALLVIVILAENWAPVRFYLFGLALELPKSVAFVLDLVLGAVLMWLLLRRAARGEEASE